MALTKTEVTVVSFGGRRPPRVLAGMRVVAADSDPIGSLIADAHRIAVLGHDSDLASVLTALMRAELLDIEVAWVRGRPWTPLDARRAIRGSARRVPLIRDDTGAVVVSSAIWLPPDGSTTLRGEAVVDDTVLFDGDVAGVRIEPTAALPGLRARVSNAPLSSTGVLGRGPWISGRAAQLGTTGVRVIRDGVPGSRELKRSTFYRHTTGWLRVL